MKRIMITSGRSFLGSHLAVDLQSTGYEVVLAGDESSLQTDLAGVDTVIHLLDADESWLTPALLAAMAVCETQQLVLESSLEVYGEGLYADSRGRLLVPPPSGDSVPLTDGAGQRLTPLPTPETTPPSPFMPAGIAALTRETEARAWAEEHDRHICVLRLAPLFGPPHSDGRLPDDEVWRMMTEVAAGQPPQVPGDGGQIRDWLHVRDAARALRLAVEYCDRGHAAMNITSGEAYSSCDIAHLVASAAFHYELAPLTGIRGSAGARHLVGQPGKAAEYLGFTAGLPLQNSLGELTMWLAGRANDLPLAPVSP